MKLAHGPIADLVAATAAATVAVATAVVAVVMVAAAVATEIATSVAAATIANRVGKITAPVLRVSLALSHSINKRQSQVGAQASTSSFAFCFAVDCSATVPVTLLSFASKPIQGRGSAV